MSEASDQELHVLRVEIARLHAEATRNEEVYTRTRQREVGLLAARQLPALLAAMTTGLRESAHLQAVALALEDRGHELRHLLLADGLDPDALPGVLFLDGAEAVLPVPPRTDEPWLGAFAAATHGRLFEEPPASLALLRLEVEGRLLGVLALGSADPRRFEPGMATDFLAHLGAVAGFALDSASDRARLARAGHTDFLTGWHNKRYLYSRLAEELSRSQRSGQPLALMMIDLDHFKQVNDVHGHPAGDLVLREVASRIASRIRSGDVAARFGGDEFALMLPGAGPQEAWAAARRLLQAAGGSPIELGPGLARTITLSIGIGIHEPPAGGHAAAPVPPIEELIARADAALYRSKQAGRNQATI